MEIENNKLFTFTEKSFLIYENSKYLRRFYYEQFEKLNYSAKCLIQTRTEDNQTILELTKATEEERNSYKKGVEQEKINKFNEILGFTRIFEIIKENKKVILVGHNCFYDFMFLMSHFNDQLDDKYYEYKKTLHQFFPRIYDTKILTNYQKNIKDGLGDGNSFLEKMYELSNLKEYENIFQDIRITFPEKFSYKIGENGKIEGVYHEAGFDAFVTGLIFLKLGKKMGQENLLKFENLVNFFGSSLKMNLNGDDLFYCKYNVHIVKLKGKQDKGKTNDKKEDPEISEFKEAFQAISHQGFWTQQKFIDNQPYLYIIIEEKHEQKEEFLKIIAGLKSTNKAILTYEEFISSRKGQPLKYVNEFA